LILSQKAPFAASYIREVNCYEKRTVPAAMSDQPVDETGVRVEAKRQWLHVASTQTHTHYKIAPFEQRYDSIVAQGYLANPPPESVKNRGRKKQGKARNMLNRLSLHHHEVLAFM
jgi:hypothetical protein